jgi:hypothetical protein
MIDVPVDASESLERIILRHGDYPVHCAAEIIAAGWTPPGSAPEVTKAMMNALRSYKQADEDGVMVLVSRQALDEAIAALSAQQGEGSQ